MPASAAAVVNIALEYIASQARITDITDTTSPTANISKAATVVYAPTVQLMLRELDPDFARFDKTLILSGVTPTAIWAYEYLYPSDCLRLRQVRPVGVSIDPNNPRPVRANVGFDVIGGVPTKVIYTNEPTAHAVYTTSRAIETFWDDVFTDAVARRLANPLAMALSGRPDFAKEILETSARVAATAEMVDESSVRLG
jgi:hypothetical protein